MDKLNDNKISTVKTTKPMCKNYLLCFVLLFVSFSIFAQLPCGNKNISYEEEQIVQTLIKQYSKAGANNRLSVDPTYIAVKPHFVRTDASQIGRAHV